MGFIREKLIEAGEANPFDAVYGIAYHEAAHAVFAYHSRIYIHEVYVFSDENGLHGRCNAEDPEALGPFAIERAAYGLAGIAAMWRELYREPLPELTLEEFSGEDSDYSENDVEIVMDMLQIAKSSYAVPHINTIEEAYAAAKVETERRLDRYWSEIRRVANRITDDEVLDGEEVAMIIEQVDYPPPED